MTVVDLQVILPNREVEPNHYPYPDNVPSRGGKILCLLLWSCDGVSSGAELYPFDHGQKEGIAGPYRLSCTQITH